MRIRVSANLSYSRQPGADPTVGAYEVLQRLMATVDTTLVEAGYSPNRIDGAGNLDDTLAIEVM